MKKKLILILFSVTLILELLPYGAVLNFANPEGEPFRETYSYFSMMPFGYANFGPLLTAILTVVLLILSVFHLAKDRTAVRSTISILSFIASILSLTPLLFGINTFSFVAALISTALISAFAVSLTK